MADTGQMNITFGVNGGDSVTREAKRIEQSLNKLVGKIEHQAKTLSMTAREMDLYKAHTMKADAATLGHINSLHDSIEAQKNQAKAIQDSIAKADAELKAKQAMEAQERSRADSINSIISELQREQSEMGQSSDEIQIRKAMMEGATDAELNQIHALQSSIAAHKAKVAEDKKNAVETKKAEQANKAKDASIDRIVESLKDEANMLTMTTDQIQLYKAAKMGATQAQLDSIKAAQNHVKVAEQQAKADGKLRNSLQMMRGGFGQVGHQIQDVSVQMQMNTNGMIILGQQGSQIASLFGSGGAMIGAFIAVGAAIYTYLNAEAVAAAKELKTLKDDMKELSLTSEGLSQGLTGIAIVETGNKIEELQNQVVALSEDFEDSQDRVANFQAYQMFGGTLDTLTYGLSALAAEFYFSDQAMKESNENIALNAYYTEELNKRIEKQEQIRKRLANGDADPFFKHAEGSEKFRQRLIEQQEELGKTADEILRLNAVREAGGDSEVAAQNLAIVETYITRKNALAAFQKAQEEYEAAAKARHEAAKQRDKEAADRANKENEFVAAIQAKAKATQMDKYETVLQSEEYKKLGAYKQLLVRLAVKEWKATDELAKKKAEEAAATQAQADTVRGVIEALEEENKLLDLQIEQNYSAAEASIAYTLSKNGETQASIDNAIAMQKEIDKKRELLNTKDDDTSSTGKKDNFGQLSDDVLTDMDVLSDIQGVEDGFKSEQELLKEHYGEMNAIIEEGEALGLLTKEEMTDAKKKIDEEYAKASEAAQLQAMSSLLSTAQSQMQGMQEVFGESTAIGKAFYVASQAMAATQAIISGLSAKMNVIENATALGMDAGTASAIGSTMATMGFATAGAIMGQTMASFEGGGITFNGVRSGGMDGKGGRMALVHPNEKITDMEKGGSTGQPVNVSFTINAVDTKGFDQLLQSRRGQIVGMVQKAVNNVGRRIM